LDICLQTNFGRSATDAASCLRAGAASISPWTSFNAPLDCFLHLRRPITKHGRTMRRVSSCNSFSSCCSGTEAAGHGSVQFAS
jgi:hypothetical protein